MEFVSVIRSVIGAKVRQCRWLLRKPWRDWL